MNGPDKRYARNIEQGKQRRLHILRDLADNYSLQQAAERDGMSYSTAKYHLMILREMSGCSHIGGVIGWAFRNKLVE